MPYIYYIKSYADKQIELYFENVPHYSVRSVLKSNGWYWLAEKVCWTTSLSKQSEQLAISLGAIDGTAPNSNPATSTDQMDLSFIRKSMCQKFKSRVFEQYSLRQIKDYLDNLPKSNPLFPIFISSEQSNANCVKVLLGNLENNNLEWIVLTDNAESIDEYQNVYSLDSPFAKALLRSVAFSRSYILYKDAVYEIYSVTDTAFLKCVIQHTQKLNDTSDYVDVWIYRLKSPCHPEHMESVTAFISSDRAYREQPINVTYCPICNRYFINIEQYRAFTKMHGLPYIRLKMDISPDYSAWQEESLLHLMGYNVSSVDNLSDGERRAILEHAIDTDPSLKPRIIGFLEFLIHQNENNMRFVNACSKWRSDVEHIRKHRISEQRYIRGRLLRRF